MQDRDDDVEIGPGGWVLVALGGAATFGVLRYVLSYDLFPSLVFALAISLVVVLLLFRLAAAIDRMDEEEAAAQRVRRIVPATMPSESGARSASHETAGVSAVRVAPMRPSTAGPGPLPSAVVTPLSEVDSAPLIAPPPLAAAPATRAPAVSPVVDEVAVSVPVVTIAPDPKVAKGKAAPKPKAAAPAKSAVKAKPAAKGSAKGGAATPKATTTGWTTKPETAPAAETGPKRLSAPRNGRGDDLTLISGIGPKLEALCHRLGIYHFDQIAAWTPAEVFWMDDNLEGFRGRVSRDNWVAQARVLAKGGSVTEAEKAAKS
jgi:predicted flap endonuclease-1-like 5' DNA nuclease